ncbi:MAG: hypothetical protein HXY21_02850 [Parvularculaceae bacterium]|nr:hypothetical protein [Parvularculaceae bacterium]
MRAETEMEIRDQSLILLIGAMALSSCGFRDCNAPANDGVVFTPSQVKAIQLKEGETKAIAFTFYPKKPYRLPVAQDEQNPRISVSVFKSSQIPIELLDDLRIETKGKVAKPPPNRALYGPDHPHEFSILVSRKNVSDNEMQIRFEGYRVIVVPRDSVRIDVNLILFPDLDCIGDSGDPYVSSPTMRIDL